MQHNKKHFKAALAQENCDLIIKNARLVNVFSGRIEESVSIAIAGEQIVGIGPDYVGNETIDVHGQYVYPALIDAHIHLESTKLTVAEATKLMLRFGTGTVVTDPHEIANVAALDGLAFQMDCAAKTPYVNVFLTAPSCVPALPDPGVESFASTLDAKALNLFAHSEQFVALGEMMNVPGLLMQDEDVIKKIEAYQQRALAIDGHAPLLGGPALNACIYAGVRSDHESSQLAEAQEKLDRGMYIMIREGSSEHNFDSLIALVNEHNAMRIMLCSDDLDPADLAARGHINHLLKRAVLAGLSPIRALQLATLAPANYFNLSHKLGAIFPGAQADIVVAPDLQNFEPSMVIHKGRVLYKDGAYTEIQPTPMQTLRPCMNVKLPEPDDLAVPKIPNAKYRAISLVENQIITNEHIFEPQAQSDFVLPDAQQNIAKVVVFERHKATGAFHVGFVHGFGLKKGAFGSSVAHDSHNLIVVGNNDYEILVVAARIRDLGGAQVALCDGHFVQMPLPIAGLMSDLDADSLIAQEHALHLFCAQTLGLSVARPFAALSFLSLPVIPHLRITDQGLFGLQPGGYPQKLACAIPTP